MMGYTKWRICCYAELPSYNYLRQIFFNSGYSYPGEIGASGRDEGKRSFYLLVTIILVTGFMDCF
jgi:hypothetical protein